MLADHAAWLKSGAPPEERVGFDGRTYRNVTFEGSLAQANFYGATFRNCTFMPGLDLAETDFTAADLTGADLSETQNLSEHRLGASKLSYAKLPKDFSFHGLELVKQTATSAEKILYALAATCATAVVLTRVIPHLQLFLAGESINLPVLGLPVPIRTFFNLAPWLLLVPYVYLLSTLLKLWSAQRDLPAILPNNRLLFREIPASPNFCVMPFGWCWRRFPARMGKRRDETAALARLTRVDRWIVVVAVWWLVPGTITWLWASYLHRHSGTDTAIQVLAVALAVGVSIGSYGRMLAHLTRGCRDRTRAVRIRFLWRDDQRRWMSAMDLLLHTDARGRLPSPVAPRRLRAETVGACVFSATLALGAISVVALGPGGCEDELGRWERERGGCYRFGANLARAQLDSVSLSEQNLRRAFLIDASLKGTVFEDALMQGAQLSGADARGANLKDAWLSGAILWETKLDRAKLKEAHLEGASLRGASLAGAELQGVHFNGADLTGARLDGAIVCGADFTGVTGEPGALLANARGGYLTKGHTRLYRAPDVDPALHVPSFLTSDEQREFMRWAAAERALERLDHAVTRHGPSGWLPRDEVADLTANLNVSMAANTQRRQFALVHFLSTHALRQDRARLPYTPEVRMRLDSFIDAVQDKVRNHCVLPTRSTLPTAARSTSPFWTSKIGETGPQVSKRGRPAPQP